MANSDLFLFLLYLTMFQLCPTVSSQLLAENEAYLPRSDETTTSEPLLCSSEGSDLQAIWI